MSGKGGEKPIHKVSFESLVAWGCLCGARWYNEQLRGKSDEDLILERERAFEDHVRQMQRQGF